MSKEDFSILESSDGINFQLATFPSRNMLRQSSEEFFIEESSEERFAERTTNNFAGKSK